MKEYLIATVVVAAAALPSEKAYAQAAGCPCGIVSKSISSAHSATRTHVTRSLKQLEASVVVALQEQTRQLSAGQEKMLAALEALHDAEMETLRRVENEKVARQAAFDRASTQSGCLAATGAKRVQNAAAAREEVTGQLRAAYNNWNEFGGVSNKSVEGVADNVEARIADRPEEAPTLGALLNSPEDLDDEALNDMALLIQMLTNPTPEVAPVLDGAGETAEEYLRIKHRGAVRSVIQEYFAGRDGRRAMTFEAGDWYQAATGEEPPAAISEHNFLLSEGRRRFLSLGWHGEQKLANETVLVREQNRMVAYELYLRTHEYEQQERQNDLLATLVGLLLEKPE